MRARVFIIFRVIALVIVLPVLAIYFSPPSKVIAQCSPVDSGQIRVDQGLISASDQAPFSPKSATANVYCVSGNRATIPPFALITYDEMKTLYYDQANVIPGNKIKKTGDQTLTGLDLSAPSDKLYWLSTDRNYLSVSSDTTISGSGTRVIFVDGSLIISGDLTHTSNTAGLVFIVQGQILIKRSVKRVDAFLIAYGNKSRTDVMPFCSAWDGASITSPTCADVTDRTAQARLTINGSVISLNTTQPPQFVRQKSDDLITPAEIIKYQPKYLIILKDIFSRDVKIWKEIQ